MDLIDDLKVNGDVVAYVDNIPDIQNALTGMKMRSAYELFYGRIDVGSTLSNIMLYAADSPSSLDDYYKGQWVFLGQDPNVNNQQARLITGYTASTRTLTVSPPFKDLPTTLYTDLYIMPGSMVNTITNSSTVQLDASQPNYAPAQAGDAMIASNMVSEPDNADIQSVKIVTDMLNGLIENVDGNRFTAKALEEAPTGGSSITAQDVRDAMKLAPSAGDPSEGSIDKKIDDIQSSNGTSPQEVWEYPTRTLSSRNIAANEDLAREQTLTGNISSGVLQNMVTVTDSSPQAIIRGDIKSFTFNLGVQWDLTGGKKVYFIAKADRKADNSTAIVNRECTVTDAANGVATITLTSAETQTVGAYYAEVEVRDSDDTNPHTARQFFLRISQDVRQ